MASGKNWKLRALIKKNILILKRNIVSTLFEILFPIILMLLSYAIRKAFTLEKFEFTSQEGSMENYIKNKSVVNFDDSSISFSDLNVTVPTSPTWSGLSILPALKICSFFNSMHQPRPLIATIGIPNKIKDQIIEHSKKYEQIFQLDLTYDKFRDFDNITELNKYITSSKYGQKGNPLICF